MKLTSAYLKLIAYVLQTDGKVNAEGQVMPRYFDTTERNLAVILFRKVRDALVLAEKDESGAEIELTEEEITFIKSLLNIPFTIQDGILVEEFISLLDTTHV